MVNTFLFPSSKQPYRQTLRNAAMNIKIQVGNSHIFPTRQEVADKTLGGVHKLCVDKILPIIDPLSTPCWHFCKNYFTELRENLHTVDHFQYHPPNSSCQRSLWMLLYVLLWMAIKIEFEMMHLHSSTTVCLVITSWENDLS